MIKLMRPTIDNKNQVMAYRKEFIDDNDNLAGTSYLRNYESYDKWPKFVLDNEKEETKHTEVTASVFLALDTNDNLVGIFNIRHALNDYLFNYGGHIGYSVKASERRKGYAKEMLGQGLDQCRKLGLERVLLACNAENIGSIKTIKAYGGALENEVDHDGEKVQRYWINLE